MEDLDFDSYEDKPEDEEELEEEQIFISKVMRGLKLAGVEGEKMRKKRSDLDHLNEDEKKETGKSGFRSIDYTEAVYHTLEGEDKYSKKVEMKVYAPRAFRDIRRLCKVNPREFVEAWDFHKKEIPQPRLGAGRSGSLFITAKNKKFLFKTIPHFEVETLQEILPHLHKHYAENPGSRIARFLGLYRFKGGTDMHVIIMTNLLWHPGWPIHQKYDLKGRKPKPGKAQRDVENKEKTGAVLKDNDDLTRKFHMDEPAREELLKTLTNDVNFLLTHNCMDYSLLVGVHQKKRMLEDSESDKSEKKKKKKEKKKEATRQGRSATVAVKPKGDAVEEEAKAASDGEDKAGKKKKGKKGGKAKEDGEKEGKKKKKEEKRAKKAKKAAEYHEDVLAPVLSDEEHQEVYFIGIIDPLSRYNTKKKVAHLLKITLWEPETLSTIPAAPYATRYLNYLNEIFPPKGSENGEEADEAEEKEKDGKDKKEKGSKKQKGSAKEDSSSKEDEKETNKKGEKKGKKEKAAKEESSSKEGEKENSKKGEKKGKKEKAPESPKESEKVKGSKREKAAKKEETNNKEEETVKGSKRQKAAKKEESTSKEDGEKVKGSKKEKPKKKDEEAKANGAEEEVGEKKKKKKKKSSD